MRSHADAIRAAFSFQADYISTSPAFLDQERLDWLLRLASVDTVAGASLDRMDALDVACGAGVVAEFLSRHVRHVTGIDMTPAVLEKAEALANQKGMTNARFLLGDATAIPLPDSSVDMVTCTSAFHHFDEPEQVVAEIVRVLRPGGIFCAIDITTSEVPWKRTRHQEMERLRDPSHTTNLTPSAWRKLAQRSGLRVTWIGVVPSHRSLEEWLTVCPEENKQQVRELFVRDISEGQSGLDVRRDGNEILFTHPMLLMRAEKI